MTTSSDHNVFRPLWLTFDDGPSPLFETSVLPLLAQYKVKALFFFCGKLAEKYPDIVRAVAIQGHEVGNHTWDHPRLTQLKEEEIADQIDRTSQTLFKITQKPPLFFRAPYGAINSLVSKVVQQKGLIHLSWTLDPQDWKNPPAKSLYRILSRKTRPWDIVLLHSRKSDHLRIQSFDTSQINPEIDPGKSLVTREVLPEILHYYKESGFQMNWPLLLALQRFQKR